MRKAKDVFELHLNSLRNLADEKGLHLADVLAVLSKKSTDSEMAIVTLAEMLSPELRITELVEAYRPRFYESLADEYSKTIREYPVWNCKEVSEAVKIAKQQQANLDGGRKKGTNKRQESSRKKKDALRKAIASLFAILGGEGWRWDNDQITRFLLKRFPGYDAPSTMLAFVSGEAKKHRQAEKWNRPETS